MMHVATPILEPSSAALGLKWQCQEGHAKPYPLRARAPSRPALLSSGGGREVRPRVQEVMIQEPLDKQFLNLATDRHSSVMRAKACINLSASSQPMISDPSDTGMPCSLPLQLLRSACTLSGTRFRTLHFVPWKNRLIVIGADPARNLPYTVVR